MELTTPQRYAPSIWMAQLRRSMLTTEARKVLEGITCVEEAWQELGRRFGSGEIAIVSAKQELFSLHLKGAQHEQVESLLQAMRSVRTLLKAVKAEQHLFSDFSTPAILVSKLPPTLQERWHAVAPEIPEGLFPQHRGERFFEWMCKEGEAAASARHAQMACDMQQHQNSQQKQNSQHNPKAEESNTATGLSFHAAGSQVAGRLPPEEFAKTMENEEGAKKVKEQHRLT